MPDKFDRRLPRIVAAQALTIVVLAALLGGPGAMADGDAIRLLAAQRTAHVGLTSLAIGVTNGGGAAGMVSILVLAIAILAFQRRWKLALLLGVIDLGGRAAVELLKLAVDRPRPHFGPYPVNVSSLSFPSGHAANSMITFLAMAVLLVPSRYRVMAVTAAVCLSGVIGSTRPYLGVHWPSDVIGGWAFGIAWVVTAVQLARASNYWPALNANRAE